MTRFLDGPATGHTAELRRAPKFLRLLRGDELSLPWSPLDMLDDEAPPAGELWCYYRVTTGGSLRPDGRCRVTIAYVLYRPQPKQDVVRDTKAWRRWCLDESQVAVTMRSEEAIRRHLENLKWAQAQPCDCAAGPHALRCRIGGMCMTAAIKNLEWALGDNDDIGGSVERIAQDRAREGG